MEIKHRSILKLALLTVFTFGIYPYVWYFKTRKEINSLGADIPTAWLLFVPFGFLYFYFKYAQAFSEYVKKDDKQLFYFLFLVLPSTLIVINPILYLINFGISFIPMMIFQLGLNELNENKLKA